MTQRAMSLQDVADLARVQRPVVSMWRRRPRVRGRAVPFPAAVSVVAGVELFDRDAVVDWLSETGRGNNPDARLEASAVAVPRDTDIEDVTTLLCLYALTGAELSPIVGPGLVALAAGADPSDLMLRREVEALRNPSRLSRYVDDLVEASFGPEDALERVTSGPLARREGRRGLTDDLVDVVWALADTARSQLGPDDVILVPPSVPELWSRLPRAGFAGLRIAGDEPAARTLRRRATILGIAVLDEPARSDPARPDPAVHVRSVVGQPARAALDSMDDLVLSLGTGDVGLVIGPAALLCEQLDGDEESQRARTLRGGNLVMAVRMPRGRNRAAHRQALGLWVLRGGRNEQRPLAADLDGEAVVIDDLASDLADVLDLPGRRAYRYARQVDLAPILAGGPVVPRGVRADQLRAREPAGHLDRITATTLITSEPISGFDLIVDAAPGRVAVARRSLAELQAGGHLRLIRGTRVDPGDADPDGTLRVIHAHPTDDFALDPLDAVRLHPRASRTEPGDVVFTAKPVPRARVDDRGGAVVAAPHRVLRLSPGSPVGPHTLAALINETAPAGSEWQTWAVPTLPSGDVDILDHALAAAQAYQARLRRHAEAMDRLVTTLIDGVAAGAVTVHSIHNPAPERKAG